MLLGKHFRRGHERPLVPALHCNEQRTHRYHGLSGSHLTLKQPVHRNWARQIVLDLVYGSPLRICERERELAHERLDQSGCPGRPTDHVPYPTRVAFSCQAAHHHLQLEPEQFVEGKSVPRAAQLRERPGSVHLREGRRAVDQSEGLAPELRKRVLQTARAPQGLGDPVPELPPGDARALRGRIDRHDPSRAVADQVDHWIRQLSTSFVGVELPEE